MNATHPARSRTLWSLLFDVLGTSTMERNVAVQPAFEGGRWCWLYVDKNGVAMCGPAACFETQDAAEHWAEDNAAGLRAMGISALTLRDGEHAIYGPTAI